MKNKLLTTLAVLPFLLSCKGNGIPKKGYEKLKNYCENIMIIADPNFKDITWKSCNYILITDGKNYDPDLKDTCWYTMHCILNFNDGSTVYDTEWGVYADADESVWLAENATAINNITLLLSSGAIDGATGSL